MTRLAALLATLAAVTILLSSPARAELLLRYRGRSGQVAVYRLTLKATGEQVSLGEPRPINVEAELELREEVTATGPGDVMTVRITPRVIRSGDPAGTFGNGEDGRFPEVEVTTNSRGETLSARPLTDEHVGPYQRAFALLMAAPSVVLPEDPVSLGDTWTWQSGGDWQKSRFAGAAKRGPGMVARIETTATAPVTVREESPGLGLSTTVSGSQTQRSVLELMTDTGVVLGNKGVVRISTKGHVVLDLEQGQKVFPIASGISVSYQLRLVRLDGKAIRRH